IGWLLAREDSSGLLAQAESCRPVVEAWKDDKEYWKRGSWADYLLTVGLLQGNLDVDAIAKAYQSALATAGKKVEQLSVIEHIEFIAEMLKNEQDETRARLAEQADELVKKLRND
ncbi:MAG TPA: hypothetical protein VHL59_04560, partial [Thermoanaerobaculia bacterium]|nr:hypothetical protein [Thermoanaerobaculia bacterium]